MLESFALHVARLSAWLVMLAVVFVPIERMFGLRPERIFRKDFGADLFYYFLGGILPSVLLAVPLALMAAGAQRLIPADLQHAVNDLPLWLRVTPALVISDAGSYWGHRWSHEIPFLWRLHAVHHSAEHIDWLVNTRAHPVDLVFTRLCGLFPLYALGFAGAATPEGSLIPIITTLFGTFWGFFIHANVRWRLGPLEYLISSPAFHHWHHTVRDPLDRNYAALLPGLDRLFGTYYLPRRDWPEAYGVRTPVASDVPRQLVDPFTPRP